MHPGPRSLHHHHHHLRKFHPHSTVCVFRRPFPKHPPNWVKIYPTVLAEGSFYSLKVGLCFLAGWRVLAGRGLLQLCSAASPGQAEGARAPSLVSLEGREGQVGTELLLLLGAVRPTMLRGATLAAQRQPCALLLWVGKPLLLASQGVCPSPAHGTGIPVGAQALSCPAPTPSHPPRLRNRMSAPGGLASAS